MLEKVTGPVGVTRAKLQQAGEIVHCTNEVMEQI